MLLIVGLGNPGPKYASTRHNIGCMVVDHVLKDTLTLGKSWGEDADRKALVCKKGDLVFAKPLTFMNGSGFAVKKLSDFYKIKPEDIWVVQDDIDLPLGKIRLRVGGGSAGHHGIESIMRELGNDTFVRFRLGVGRGKLEIQKGASQNLHRRSVEKYVVSPFTDHEAGAVRKLIKHAAEAMELALHKGLDVAMNQYN
ncbi:MAG: aminoacyl-tRNA hydrolase [Patescibacteria group bacterium]